MNRAQAPKTTIRLPADVSEWLRDRAAHSVTSVTAEIIRAVRDRIAPDRRAECKAEAAVD
jgi:Arc-like DNA binding dprotein